MMTAEHLETLRAQAAVPIVVLLSAAPGTDLVLPGPPAIVLFGVAVPTLSALFAVAGVVLGRMLAPSPAVALGARRTAALWIALILIALTIVIATGQLPLVALGWGIGLGFSGLTVAETLGSQAGLAVRRLSDAFISMLAARIGGKKDDGNA